MKRRWLIRLGVVAILAGFVVWLEPTRIVWGWLRGEAFYQNRPTTWWADELGHWDYYVQYAMGMHDGHKVCHEIIHYVRRDSRMEAWWKSWFSKDEPPPPPNLFMGDDAAEPVLRELAEHPSEQVRKVVEHALNRLEGFRTAQRIQQHEMKDAEITPEMP